MTRFLVGIVGTGVIAQNAHLPVLLSMPNVRVAWLADADSERGRLVGEANGVPHIQLPDSPAELPECDVVLLAIPLAPRQRYYEQLSARGTAVLAEKPFAINSRDHRMFQRLFPPHKIACGYQRRMYSSSRLLRRIVKEAWFGPLRRIHIREGGRTTKTGVDQSYQDLSVRDGGGILINLGCHALDLACFISGAKGFELLSHEVEYDGHTDRKAQGEVALLDLHGTGNKCKFRFCLSWIDIQPNTLELEFDHCTLVCPISPDGTIAVRSSSQAPSSARLEAVDRDGAVTINQAVFLEWREFLQGLEAGRPSMMTAATSEMTARLIDEVLDVDRKDGGE